MSNKQDRYQAGGLLQENIPAVIRDAVAVASRLGISFIWVDALCIVQDDPEDKNRKLGKMSQYYKNSYLTVVASTLRCTTGFIGKMERCEKHPKSPLPRDLVPLDVFCRLESDKGYKTGKVYVRQENPYRYSEEPINKRAWTLQEGLLAPRVLFFGSRVIWACRHMIHSDGGVEDWSFDDVGFQGTRREFQTQVDKRDQKSSGSILTSQGQHAAHNNIETYDLWHRIVGSYFRRNLSYSEDKLPAISAVATEFARLSKDEYIAGLWRSNLLRDLLWSMPKPATTPAKIWRASSWFWASVDDAIIYDKLPPADSTLLAKVETVEAIPSSEAVPFGQVKRGTLEITAPCFLLNNFGGQEKARNPWLSGYCFQSPSSERGMLLDALKFTATGGFQGKDEEVRLPDKAVAVVIYAHHDDLFDTNDAMANSKEDGDRWTMWGLILRPVEDKSNDNVYERVFAFSQVHISFKGFEVLGGPFSLGRRRIKII
jgi:hypothetical protein